MVSAPLEAPPVQPLHEFRLDDICLQIVQAGENLAVRAQNRPEIAAHILPLPVPGPHHYGNATTAYDENGTRTHTFSTKVAGPRLAVVEIAIHDVGKNWSYGTTGMGSDGWSDYDHTRRYKLRLRMDELDKLDCQLKEIQPK